MSSETGRSLEISSKEFAELVGKAVEGLSVFIDSLDTQPACRLEGAEEVARGLLEELPELPSELDPLDLLFGEREAQNGLVYQGLNPSSPGYMAYVPGGGILHSAVADLIADSVNRYVGLWHCAPGLVQLEINVIRWFCDIVGFPESACGFLTSGGSIANLSAVLVARSEKLGETLSKGTVYFSTQTHHSVVKSIVLAGIPRKNFRMLPADSRQKLSLDRLSRQIEKDKDAGLRPFLVIGNAGTTNTGAVDDLKAISEISRANDLWFHVDAAYGGFFALTARGRAALTGIEAADSVVLDPHKGLFLPYGTGSVLVRDGQALKRTFSVHADYMPPTQPDPELVDFSAISPELSRDFRGLRVWLPIKKVGIKAFREALDEKYDLARWASCQLKAIPQLELVAEPELSILAFRLKPPGRSLEALNSLNVELLQRVNDQKRVHLSGTLLGDTFVLRICVLSFRTHLEQMRRAIEDIRSAAATILGSGN